MADVRSWGDDDWSNHSRGSPQRDKRRRRDDVVMHNVGRGVGRHHLDASDTDDEVGVSLCDDIPFFFFFFFFFRVVIGE